MSDPPADPPPTPRPHGWRRLAAVPVLLAGGLALAQLGATAALRWEFPAVRAPAPPDAVIVLVVTDARTDRPVAGAEVLHEVETGDINAEPEPRGRTDSAGRIRLVCGFPTPALRGRGPHERATLLAVARGRLGSDSFVVRASSYKEARVAWTDIHAALLDHRKATPREFPVALRP